MVVFVVVVVVFAVVFIGDIKEGVAIVLLRKKLFLAVTAANRFNTDTGLCVLVMGLLVVVLVLVEINFLVDGVIFGAAVVVALFCFKNEHKVN